MEIYWAIVVIIVSLSFTATGIYMTYDAFTGKKIPEIKIEESFGLWVQYKMRGIIGVTFAIGGIVILFAAFG